MEKKRVHFLGGCFHSAIICTALAREKKTHSSIRRTKSSFVTHEYKQRCSGIDGWKSLTYTQSGHTLRLVDNSEVHTFTTHLLLYKDGMLQMLHQLLKAMERSGLSLVDGALALVTHSLNAPTPLLSLHATWFLCTPHPFRPPQPPLTEHKRKSPHPSPPCVGPPHPSSLCLCPSLASFPLPHPKGTRYPSPTHSPRHSSSICLSSFQWPVTSFHFPCDCCWIIHAPNPPFVMIFFFCTFFFLHSWYVQTSDSACPYLHLLVLYSHYTSLTNFHHIFLQHGPISSFQEVSSEVCVVLVYWLYQFSLNSCHQIMFKWFPKFTRMLFDNAQPWRTCMCMCKQ